MDGSNQQHKEDAAVRLFSIFSIFGRCCGQSKSACNMSLGAEKAIKVVQILQCSLVNQKGRRLQFAFDVKWLAILAAIPIFAMMNSHLDRW